jgi:hypothetical protein
MCISFFIQPNGFLKNTLLFNFTHKTMTSFVIQPITSLQFTFSAPNWIIHQRKTSANPENSQITKNNIKHQILQKR